MMKKAFSVELKGMNFFCNFTNTIKQRHVTSIVDIGGYVLSIDTRLPINQRHAASIVNKW